MDNNFCNSWKLHGRDASRRVTKFIYESNTFHIESKVIKMLSCKSFATLLDPPLIRHKVITRSCPMKYFRLRNDWFDVKAIRKYEAWEWESKPHCLIC